MPLLSQGIPPYGVRTFLYRSEERQREPANRLKGILAPISQVAIPIKTKQNPGMAYRSKYRMRPQLSQRTSSLPRRAVDSISPETLR